MERALYSHDVDILCLTEHWKSESELIAYIPNNYVLASSCCRDKGRHGGCAIFLKDGMQFKDRLDFKSLTVFGSIECCGIQTIIGPDKYLITCIYRPNTLPLSDIDIFFENFILLIEQCLKENIRFIIAGDFNIDLLCFSKESKMFLKVLEMSDLHITIKEPTRITSTSATCVDNVISNFQGMSTVVEEHLSDHCGQKFIFKVDLSPGEKNDKRNIRRYNELNHQVFQSLLSNTDWSEIYSIPENNINEMWLNFSRRISESFQRAFPLSTVNIFQKKKIKITPEIESLKELLDSLFVISKVKPEYCDTYKKIKFRYDVALSKNKRRFYSSTICNAPNKSIATWNVIREITNKNRTPENKLPSKYLEQSVHSRMTLLANDFNTFFVNVPPSFQMNGDIKSNFNKNAKDPITNSLYLFEVLEPELLSIVRTMKNKNSSGHDEIPITVIKHHIDSIIKPLSYIINNVFKAGIFPDDLKKSLVKPYFKKGNSEDFSNYRPISLITSFAKIIEKILANRLVKFLQKFEALSGNQHGFIKKKSTETAVFEFTQEVLHSLENGEIPAGLFVDFSRAFDCVQHDILLAKLERYGIRGLAFKLLKNYLENRKQLVVLDHKDAQFISSEKSVLMGVPQGTILGPILFVIYINDLPEIFQSQHNLQLRETLNAKTFLYADDTNILVSSKDLATAMNGLKVAMNRIKNWCTDNYLILNDDKTKVSIFTGVRSNVMIPDNITFDNNDINITPQVKLLGIDLDKHLNWGSHCESLSSRLNKVVYTLKVLREKVDLNTLKVVYYSNFQSLLSYGIIFWGGSSQAEGLFISQKMAIRIMFRMKFRQSCRGIFKLNNMLTLPGLHIYRTLLFFYKNKHYFHACKNFNTTRRTCEYFFPSHKLTLSERNTFYLCIKLYNCLPRCIRNLTSYDSFRKALFTQVLNCEPYSLIEFINYCR